jgi:hypothetical protein
VPLTIFSFIIKKGSIHLKGMAQSRLGETGGFLTEVHRSVPQPKDKILIQNIF